MICAKKYSLESCLKVLSSGMLGVPIGQAVGHPATYRTASLLRAIWHVREVYGRIYIIYIYNSTLLLHNLLFRFMCCRAAQHQEDNVVPFDALDSLTFLWQFLFTTGEVQSSLAVFTTAG
jgi:hypothetical protein